MTLGTYQQVKDALKNFGITDYTVIDHPAAHTTEEADASNIKALQFTPFTVM